jgi:hypothetical protein
MRLKYALALASVTFLFGCAADPSPEEQADDVESVDSELNASDLELRGWIARDRCLHTPGARARKFVTFSFRATKGDDLDVSISGYASPDLRILSAEGKQLMRGRKHFEGDGDDGGFVSEARFVAPATGSYLVALRDTSTAPGAKVPAWVRPIVSLDDRGTEKQPRSCPAVP